MTRLENLNIFQAAVLKKHVLKYHTFST